LELRNWRKYLFDKFLMIAAALVVAGLGFGSFVLGDTYHVPPGWIFSAWVAAGFIVTVGWRLRSRLKQPFFVPFLLVWLVLHVIGTILVVRRFTILGIWPFTLLECWIGLAVTYWLFGLPTRNRK
jgi:hypothetical protein